MTGPEAPAELGHVAPDLGRHPAPAGRFRITATHGEGATVYAVVDTWAPEAEQPAVVASWRVPARPPGP